MKILHVFDHSLPIQDGYSYRSINILIEQGRQGMQTLQLSSAKHPNAKSARETIADFEFHRTFASSAPWARLPLLDQLEVVRSLSARLDELIATERPDLLHAHSPPLVGLAAVRAAARHRLPVVYEIRAFWEDAAVDKGACKEGDWRYRATRALETYVVRRADAVTCICDGLRNDLLSRGIAPAKLTVIPNAIDPSQFPTERNYESALATQLGLSQGHTIGFVGSFYAYEGLRLLVAAMPAILASLPSLKLLLVGGGNDETEIRKDVAALGIDNSVVFTGRVPHHEVNRYYDLIDVLVYPRLPMRLTELVTPLKPLEAMIQDRIVIASNVGGHREMINDEHTGLLFDAGNPASLTAKVIRAFGDPALQARLRANGRDYVLKERTWQRSVARYAAVYAAAMAAQAARSP
jgi:PEP-CTERM/exosortase A-associated glycosyltransferase